MKNEAGERVGHLAGGACHLRQADHEELIHSWLTRQGIDPQTMKMDYSEWLRKHEGSLLFLNFP